MEKLCDRKAINNLALLLSVAYMISYITRSNFGAIISEMERATQFSRTLLSMSVTGSFITYGAGQVLSGVLGDKFSPKKLVSFGFILTTLMNCLIPVCKTPHQMLLAWCINGFAQALMWPPIVKIMTQFLSGDDYKKTVVKVSWGSSIGTIAVYLISPIIISLAGWRYVFIFSALCGAVMLVFWNKFCGDVTEKTEKNIESEAEEEKSDFKIFTPVLIGVMVAIMLQGMLRDGVTTWMPSYIAETYNLSSVIAILTSVILPIFSIICFQITATFYRKKFKNPLACAGIVFFIGAVSAFALLALSGYNAAFSVFFSALLTGSMHGVNLLLVCMLPQFFEKQGNVSTVSGVLNSCTYIGSAASTYGIALLSQKIGWEYTLLIWVVIAAAGGIICLVNAASWKKYM